MKVNVHRSESCTGYSSFAMNADGHGQYSNIFSSASSAPLRENLPSYDDQSRRIVKIVSRGGAEAQRRDFIYDGWNRIRESIGASTKYYCWGTDLSGTLQGAGGVGGLQAVIVDGETPATYYPCYDANGNITAYIDELGAVRAEYAFDAFGQTSSQGGDMASTFSYRFSTKYADDETGLYYYGYRYYSPELGRWVSRDPIEEQGGRPVTRLNDRKGILIDANLYEFVGNTPTMYIDPFGLYGNPVPSVVISSPECGKADVTASLESVLKTIRKTYYAWDDCTKKKHCKALYSWSTFKEAWDIHPLAEIGDERVGEFWPLNYPKKGTSECKRTVVFKGNCYRANDLNYVMWGQINSLCNTTFPDNKLHTYSGSKALVGLYKARFGFSQTTAANSFVTYGYLGGSVPNCNLRGCKVDGSTPVNDLGYTWEAMQ